MIGLSWRLAVRFTDARNRDLIEHDVETLEMQRAVGIALGYENPATMMNCAKTR